MPVKIIKMRVKSVSGNVQFMQDELKSFYPATEIRQFVKIVFDHLAGFSTTDLLIKGDTELDGEKIIFIEDCVRRLKEYEPIQYILGETEFLDLKIKVNPATLIPRPETEELVMWVCEHIKDTGIKVLDIGTGSGCIALGIKSQKPDVVAEAWDVSREALHTAIENARINDLEVMFDEVDILKFIPTDGHRAKYDVIISNPPYVRESEKQQMEANVLNYEPHTALFVDDADPLIFYREITEKAKVMLKNGGYLFFEINEAFGDEVKSVMSDAGFSNVELKKDLNGKYRMVRGRSDKRVNR